MNPRMVLLKLIQDRSYIDLLVVSMISLVNWMIFLKLGFNLSGRPIKFKSVLPWSILVALATVFVKPYLEEMIFTFLINIIPILIFIFIGKIHLLKSIAIMMIVTLLDLAGLTLINIPIIIIAPGFSAFLLSNPHGLGIVAGTTIEFIFPLIVLLLSNRVDFSRQFFKKKYSGIEMGLVVISVALFVTLYYALIDYFYSPNKVIQYLAAVKMIAGWVLAITLVYVLIKFKVREKDLMELEELIQDLDISDAKKEVLKMKLIGMTNEDIAKRRGVAVCTVKTQVNDLRKEVDYVTLAERSGTPVRKAGRPADKGEGKKK